MLKIPKTIPEKGFYYHYKHDPKGSVNNYAYEVVGTGFHTEDDCRPIDANMVVYRPIYESSVYRAGKFFDIRPLEMFLEKVEKPARTADSVQSGGDGKTQERFTKITDEKIIAELEKLREEMYN